MECSGADLGWPEHFTITMKLSTLILTVLHLSSIVLMLIVLNRHYSKSSLNCPYCELLGATYSCKNNLFSSNSGFTSRLSRPQWVRWTLLGLKGSSKFMATLQCACENWGASGESLSLSPDLFSRGSCSSVGIRARIKCSHRIDLGSIDTVRGKILVWWYTSSLPKDFIN